MEATSLVIVDGSQFVADALCERLDQEDRLHVVAEFGPPPADMSVDELGELVVTHQPDVLLLDGDMAVSDELVRAVRESGAAIVMTTSRSDPPGDRHAINMGVSALVLKVPAIDELLEAVRMAAIGGMWISPALLPGVLDELRQADLADDVRIPIAELSPREREVLKLLAEGNDAPQIATTLSISEQTVRNHLRHIQMRLGVSTAAAARIFALRAGLPPD